MTGAADNSTSEGAEREDEQAAAFKMAAEAAKVALPIEPKRTRRSKLIAAPSEDDELTAATLKVRDRGQNIRLRLFLARFAVIAVSIQLGIADAVFGGYVWLTLNAHQSVDPGAMIAWLSATVVEAVGIVAIVARNLFPSSPARVNAEIKRLAKELRGRGN